MKNQIILICLFNISNACAIQSRDNFELANLMDAIYKAAVEPISIEFRSQKGINAPVINEQGEETLDNALTVLFNWLKQQPETDLLPLVRTLLNLGIDVDHTTHYGSTALLRACLRVPPCPMIITVLIEHSANPDHQNHFGQTPRKVIARQMKLHSRYKTTYQHIEVILNEARLPKTSSSI
jgi:ankyrin repeat protein